METQDAHATSARNSKRLRGMIRRTPPLSAPSQRASKAVACARPPGSKRSDAGQGRRGCGGLRASVFLVTRRDWAAERFPTEAGQPKACLAR